IDNGTAGDRMAEELAGAQERAARIDRHDLVEGLDTELGDGRDVESRGIVDQELHRPEPLAGGTKEVADIRLDADVPRHGQDSPARLGLDLAPGPLQLGLGTAHDRDVGAQRGKAQRAGLADAPSTTRNQRNGVLETTHHGISLYNAWSGSG